MDPENEARIQESIGSLAQEKTLIVVAHRLSTITGADQILVVEDGGISASGTHTELLDRSETYRTLWEAHEEAQDRATASVRGKGAPAVPGVSRAEPSAEEPSAAPPRNPYAGLGGGSFASMVLRLAGGYRREYVRRALPLVFFESVFFAAPVGSSILLSWSCSGTR